jgi:RHS repeat-associated protein
LTPTAANGPTNAFRPTTNRILASLYDNNGNQKKDGQGSIFAYDAESRMTSSTVGVIQASYAYDGDGHRVTKSSGGSTATFVYNTRGQLIAEYNGPAANGGVSYLTTDHVGSARVVTSGSMSTPVKVLARYDYQPFGEYVPATVGNRARSFSEYGQSDDTRQKFTSKERDTESNLDYFLARYYSAYQGRFTSPDEFTGGPKDLFDFNDSGGSPLL